MDFSSVTAPDPSSHSLPISSYPSRNVRPAWAKTLHRPVFELAGGLLTLEHRENCETVKVWQRGDVENDFFFKKRKEITYVQCSNVLQRVGQIRCAVVVVFLLLLLSAA